LPLAGPELDDAKVGERIHERIGVVNVVCQL